MEKNRRKKGRNFFLAHRAGNVYHGAMNDLETRYAALVLTNQLRLRPGEALSINTESSTIAFARHLATLAAKLTSESVRIVETERGRVTQVYPMDPPVPEALRPGISGLVMAHIVNLDDEPIVSDEKPATLAGNTVALGTFGLLAEPVELDRRLAVPWANIAYPGAKWARTHLEGESSEEEVWRLFASLMRLDSPDPSAFWANQATMLTYRKKRLNERGRGTLLLRGDDWSLTLSTARDTMWIGGESTVSSGRSFCSTLPLQHLSATVDAKSANGTFKATRPFHLLGKLVRNASFTIRDGAVSEYNAESGREALEAYFSIDEGAERIGSLTLSDENTRESRLLRTDSHHLFTRETTTHIGFGGFEVETLVRHIGEEEIGTLRLNQSLVHLDVPIGSSDLEITLLDGDGSHLLMEEGVFREEQSS